jgi:putative membrane protein
MIKYNPKSWIQLIFAFHKSDTVRILWRELIYMTLLSLAIAWVEINFFNNIHKQLSSLTTIYSLVGFVISLLLVFRTNTAYDRWWEGRKKWGELVNDSRNLAVKLKVHLESEESRGFFARMICNFMFAAKEHLRDGTKWELLDLTGQEYERIKGRAHPPLAIVQLMYEHLVHLKNQNTITQIEFLSLDKNLNAFMDSLGACERIKNTPIPYSYSIFLKKFIFIYTSTLPLAFVSVFGYYAALISVFVFYVIVSMEVLAEEIEDPFGDDDNDLPTDDIAERISQISYEVLMDKKKINPEIPSAE